MNRRRFLQQSAAVAVFPRNMLASLPSFDDDTSERFWQNVRKQFPGLKSLSRVDFLTSTTEGEFGGIVTFRIRDFLISDLTAKLMRDYRIRVRGVTEHKLNACRISLHIFNSPGEVDDLIAAIKEIVS